MQDQDRSLLDSIWEVKPQIVTEPEVMFEAGEIISPYGGTQVLVRLSTSPDIALQPTIERCMAMLGEITRGTSQPVPQGFSSPEQHALFSGFLKFETPSLTAYSLGCGQVGYLYCTVMMVMTPTALSEEQRQWATHGETETCLTGYETAERVSLFLQPMPMMPDPGIMHHVNALGELVSLLLVPQFQDKPLGTGM